jgi:hypothetical protein
MMEVNEEQIIGRRVLVPQRSELMQIEATAIYSNSSTPPNGDCIDLSDDRQFVNSVSFCIPVRAIHNCHN